MVEDSKVGLKLSGFFRGQIISHLPCGRCKVWIPDVYPQEWSVEKSDELVDIYGNPLVGPKIPDAEQATPLFGGGIGLGENSNGVFSYPKLNSMVWCFFEREDIQRPVYFASIVDILDMSEENYFVRATTNHPYLKHIIRVGDSTVTFDEDGAIVLENDSLAKIRIANDTVEINAKNVWINGNSIKANADLNIDLISKGDINVHAAKGTLNSTSNKIVRLAASQSFQIYGNEYIQET